MYRWAAAVQKDVDNRKGLILPAVMTSVAAFHLWIRGGGSELHLVSYLNLNGCMTTVQQKKQKNSFVPNNVEHFIWLRLSVYYKYHAAGFHYSSSIACLLKKINNSYLLTLKESFIQYPVCKKRSQRECKNLRVESRVPWKQKAQVTFQVPLQLPGLLAVSSI
jgi:hypothetical protein